MAVWVIDPACNQPSSHHIPLNDAIYNRCKTRGVAVEVGVNRRLPPHISAPFEGKAAFDSGINYGRDDNPYQPFVDMAVANGRLEQELEAWIGDRLAPNDNLVVHTASFEQLTGLAVWLAKRPTVPVSLRIVLRFHPGFRAAAVQHPVLTALYRHGIDRLRALSHVDLGFLADTIRLAELFETEMGCPFALSPVPIDFSHYDALPEARRQVDPAAPKSVLFVGEPRQEKGFHLVRAALNHHLSQPTMSFLAIVQALNFEPSQLGWTERAMERTRFIANTLAPPEYYKLIALAGLVMVPYDAREYTYRSSHILVEALGLGRPVLAVRDGWMRDEVTRMGSEDAVIFAEAFTAQAVSDALGAAMNRWPDLIEAAAGKSAAWREFHNIDRFVDLMLGTAAV